MHVPNFLHYLGSLYVISTETVYRHRMLCKLAVFTMQRYASAVYAMALCLSVSVSLTSRCSIKTAKPRIKQTTPHDSPGTVVF